MRASREHAGAGCRPGGHQVFAGRPARLPQVGTLAFISSLVQALAWPAAAVVLALIFRRQLRAVFAGLAERMKHLATLRAPWTELSFRDEVNAAATELEEIPGREALTGSQKLGASGIQQLPPDDTGAERAIPSKRIASAGNTIYGRYDQLANYIATQAKQVPPDVTVSRAWSLLEEAIRELAALLGVRDEGSFALLVNCVVDELGERGGLPSPEHTRSVVQKLLRAKFPADRGEPVTRLDGAEYMDTAFQVAQLLLRAYQATAGSTAPRADSSQPA